MLLLHAFTIIVIDTVIDVMTLYVFFIVHKPLVWLRVICHTESPAWTDCVRDTALHSLCVQQGRCAAGFIDGKVQLWC